MIGVRCATTASIAFVRARLNERGRRDDVDTRTRNARSWNEGATGERELNLEAAGDDG